MPRPGTRLNLQALEAHEVPAVAVYFQSSPLGRTDVVIVSDNAADQVRVSAHPHQTDALPCGTT